MKKYRMFARTLLKIDFFGEKPELQINGESNYPTWHGFLVSVAILTISLKYGFDKFNKMISFEDTIYR